MWNQACLRRSIDLMQVSLNSQFSILNPQSSMTLHAALHSQGAQDGSDDGSYYLKNLFDGVPFEVHNSECFNFLSDLFFAFLHLCIFAFLHFKKAGSVSARRVQDSFACVMECLLRRVQKVSHVVSSLIPPDTHCQPASLRG